MKKLLTDKLVILKKLVRDGEKSGKPIPWDIERIKRMALAEVLKGRQAKAGPPLARA